MSTTYEQEKKELMQAWKQCTPQQQADLTEYCKLNFENEFPGFTAKQAKREKELEIKLTKQGIFGLAMI